MFPGMRRFLWACVTCALLAPARPLAGAQDTAAAAAEQAARQDAEERYKRLNSLVEDLQASQIRLQKRLEALREEIQTAREEHLKSTQGQVTREDLRKLVEKVQEIDRKREEDKKLILEELKKLAAAPLPEPPPRRAANTEPPPAAPQKGYDYVIKAGDSVELIAAAYRKNGVKVTADQILKANPKLKPTKLRVGQKVFIPDPNAP